MTCLDKLWDKRLIFQAITPVCPVAEYLRRIHRCAVDAIGLVERLRCPIQIVIGFGEAALRAGDWHWLKGRLRLFTLPFYIACYALFKLVHCGKNGDFSRHTLTDYSYEPCLCNGTSVVTIAIKPPNGIGLVSSHCSTSCEPGG